MKLPSSDVNKRVALLTDLLRGQKVSQLELTLYDIEINLEEIEYWRALAIEKRTHNLPNKPKSKLPQITFKTKG